jgi:hypothetical protein
MRDLARHGHEHGHGHGHGLGEMMHTARWMPD